MPNIQLRRGTKKRQKMDKKASVLRATLNSDFSNLKLAERERQKKRQWETDEGRETESRNR